MYQSLILDTASENLMRLVDKSPKSGQFNIAVLKSMQS